MQSTGRNIFGGEILKEWLLSRGEGVMPNDNRLSVSPSSRSWLLNPNVDFFPPELFQPNTRYTYCLKTLYGEGDHDNTFHSGFMIYYTDGSSYSVSVRGTTADPGYIIGCTDEGKTVSRFTGFSNDMNIFYNECGLFEEIFTSWDNFEPYNGEIVEYTKETNLPIATICKAGYNRFFCKEEITVTYPVNDSGNQISSIEKKVDEEILFSTKKDSGLISLSGTKKGDIILLNDWQRNYFHNGLIIESMYNINGNSYSNSYADTRDTLHACIYLNDQPIPTPPNYITLLNKWIYNYERYETIEFEKTDTMRYIRFKHNGASTDISMFFDLITIPNGKYILSFYCKSLDPTTEGGLVLEDFMIEPVTGNSPSFYAPNKSIIKSCGRNLVCVDGWFEGVWTGSDNGPFASVYGDYVITKLPIKPGMKISVTTQYWTNNRHILFSNEDRKCLNSYTHYKTGKNNETFSAIAPEGTTCVWISLRSERSDTKVNFNKIFGNVMVNYGDYKAYEPYDATIIDVDPNTNTPVTLKTYDGETNIITDSYIEVTAPINESGKKITKALDKVNLIPNENLLINPDFKINQRAKTSYINEAYGQSNYCVDRWFLNGRGWVELNDGYIFLGVDVNNGFSFHQIIESKYIEPGIYTLTYKVKSFSLGERGRAFVKVKNFDNNDCYLDRIDLNVGINTDIIKIDAKCNLLVYITVETGATLEFEWIKLERGNIATKFIPPKREIELLRCYRYTYAITDWINYNLGASTTYQSDNTFTVKIDLPNKMRTIETATLQPTITINPDAVLQVYYSSTKTITEYPASKLSISFGRISEKAIIFTITINENIPRNDLIIASIRCTNEPPIVIDAEFHTSFN